MKSKAKKQKIRNKSQRSAALAPRYWFYMSASDVTIRELADSLEDDETVTVEIWEEAGVVEITLADGKTVDIEAGRPGLTDEYSRMFLEKNGIRSLFYVTIVPESFEQASAVMNTAAERTGGFFCADTEDFSPFIGTVRWKPEQGE